MAIITVTNLDDNSTVDTQVTLREAIEAANTDMSVDGSVAGMGADEIQFAPGLTLLQSIPFFWKPTGHTRSLCLWAIAL